VGLDAEACIHRHRHGVNKVALFDSDGRRIYKKRVPCEF
jgi:hypothetical protein